MIVLAHAYLTGTRGGSYAIPSSPGRMLPFVANYAKCFSPADVHAALMHDGTQVEFEIDQHDRVIDYLEGCGTVDRPGPRATWMIRGGEWAVVGTPGEYTLEHLVKPEPAEELAWTPPNEDTATARTRSQRKTG
jgi:hypothetical protein